MDHGLSPAATLLTILTSSCIGLVSFGVGSSQADSRLLVVPQPEIAHEVHCACSCPASPCALPQFFWWVLSAGLLIAWLCGIVCGSCCPRAAVTHRVVDGRTTGVQKGTKGVWGATQGSLTQY